MYDLYDLALVAGSEPYNLHDLSTVVHVSWVGSALADPARPLTAATGEEQDDPL